MSLCQIRFIKSAVSFLCVLVLVFCLVMAPLSVPAQAAFVVDDAVVAMVAGTVFLSLGYAYATNNEALQNLCNGFVQDYAKLGGRVYDLMNDIADRIGVSWDGHGQFAEVNMSRAEYAELSNAVEAWTKLHTSEDGQTIKVELPSGTYTFDTTKVTRIGFPNALATESDIRAYFGESLIYFGKGPYTSPAFYDDQGDYIFFTTVNCKEFGGNGVHTYLCPVDENGVIDVHSDCRFCMYGGSNVSNYVVCALTFFSSSSSAYAFDTTSWFPSKINNSSIPVGGFWRTDKDTAIISPLSLNKPIELPSTGSVDVPVEKDKDYAGGVVAGNWDTLIGKVGSAADSLPFNIPMNTLGGLTPADVLPKDLTQSGSIDVPNVGEGELNIPSVDSLALPSTISSFFPFCIPFDVIRLIKVFAHDPILPHFTIPFKIEGIVDTTFNFDLSMFDEVFSLARLLWDALFIAGLAAATNKYIKW